MAARNNRKLRKKNCIEIPEDIIHDILLSLPVKSLLKFRSVCKAWRDLIGSVKFIDSHLNHPSQKIRGSTAAQVLLLGHKCNSDISALSFCSGNVGGGSLRKIHLNFPGIPQYVRHIGGFCNGIFLIRGSRSYLCNPATRKCRKLPRSRSGLRWLGFGYDHRKTEYKVVGLGQSCPLRNFFKVGIFDLSKNSWRKSGRFTLDFDPTQHWVSILDDCCGLFFNGRIHWRMESWDASIIRQTLFILYFDMSNETLAYFTVPSDLPKLDSIKYGDDQTKLLVFEDSLTLVVMDGVTSSYEVWTMSEYGNSDSWTKRYRIGPWVNTLIRRFSESWNDGILLFQLEDDHLLTLDLREENAQPRRHSVCGPAHMVTLAMDKESLVSLYPIC